MPDPLSQLADQFVAARREHRRIAAAALAAQPHSAAESYRVQDEVARALGWFEGTRPRVWKSGAPSRTGEPIAAPLPDALVHASPARPAAATFHAIGIEAEIAFRFCAAVDVTRVDDPEFDWGSVLGETLVGIEIVDTRLADAGEASAWLKLADFQQNGAYVVGTGGPYRNDVEWSRQPARVLRNGAVVAATRGGHPLGDPRWLLPWFVRHVHQRSGGVRAGDLVTTGTWAGIIPAQTGERIDVEFDGVGHASVEFVG